MNARPPSAASSGAGPSGTRPGHGRPTGSPFPADADAAARLATLAGSIGPAFGERVLEAADTDARVASADVLALVDDFGLRSTREAALLAIPAAATLARPPISGYRVGAVGLTAAGDLVLGGNLEFPGASIHHTVHAEGFVTLRARALALGLAELAVRQARPCAHCRQVLAEMTWADDLRIVDPLGTVVTLWDLYPAAFTPDDLGHASAGPVGAVEGPTPSSRPPLPDGVAAGLVRAGARAHAPYSGERAAIVLRAPDDRLVEGAVLESVAFNPTIGPLQDALVALAAARIPGAAVRDAWLCVSPDARVNHVDASRDLLRAVSADAELHVTYWS